MPKVLGRLGVKPPVLPPVVSRQLPWLIEPLVGIRPIRRKSIDRRDFYWMVTRIATTAGIPRHISLHSLLHEAITNAMRGTPLREVLIPARHADPAPPSARTAAPSPAVSSTPTAFTS